MSFTNFAQKGNKRPNLFEDSDEDESQEEQVAQQKAVGQGDSDEDSDDEDERLMMLAAQQHVQIQKTEDQPSKQTEVTPKQDVAQDKMSDDQTQIQPPAPMILQKDADESIIKSLEASLMEHRQKLK